MKDFYEIIKTILVGVSLFWLGLNVIAFCLGIVHRMDRNYCTSVKFTIRRIDYVAPGYMLGWWLGAPIPEKATGRRI